MAPPVPMLMLLASVVPCPRLSVVPPLRLSLPVPLTVPVPDRSVRPPVLVRLMSALMRMSLAALRVSVKLPPAEIGSTTVIVPAWLPLVPVKTVTCEAANAASNVATFTTAESAVAMKLPSTPVCVPFEIVML